MSDVDFFGESFALNPGDEYQWEMMEFASAAKAGADSDLLSGAAAVMDFLKAVIPAADWERFRATARKNKAQVQRDLMPIVVAAFMQRVDRPTSRSSDSSDGPKTTEANSGDGSYLRVVKRLEEQGRPDLAVMVEMAEEGRLATSA